jgi:hypothetical protein
MKEELEGFEVQEEETIKCGDCDKPLVNIVVYESNDERQEKGKNPQYSKYRVGKCYHCGGSSFWTKTFEGTTAMGAYNDNVTVDIEDTEQTDDEVICSELKTSKV